MTATTPPEVAPEVPHDLPRDLSGPTEGPSTETAADYGVLRWLVVATFVVILNETVLVNAIPRLMIELDITARAAQWLSTSFMLTMAVVIPATGWFLQRVTTRRAFATAMSTFLVGTLICALAPSFAVLLAGRVVQAAGTAVMLPLLMTTLMTIVAERDRGRVMGLVTMAISAAPALGPAVSGVILHLAGWRWVFGVVVPVAALVTILGLRRLVDVGEPRAGAIDVPSIALAALGFGPLVYGLSQLGAENGGPVPPLAVLLVGIAMVAAFVLRQLRLQRTGEPLLDLRTLAVPVYARALALMSVAFMAMMGAMILLPLYLQDVRGLSELSTGLLVMPGGLAMGLLGPRIGRIFDRVGARPFVIPGSAGVLVGLGLLTRLDVGTSVAYVLGAHVLLMVSLAALFTPVFTLGLGALPPHLYSHGSSVLGTLQQVAAAVGTAVVITVMSSRAAALAGSGVAVVPALAGGLRWAFGVGAALAVLVVLLALTMPRRPAAVTETGEAARA